MLITWFHLHTQTQVHLCLTSQCLLSALRPIILRIRTFYLEVEVPPGHFPLRLLPVNTGMCVQALGLKRFLSFK